MKGGFHECDCLVFGDPPLPVPSSGIKKGTLQSWADGQENAGDRPAESGDCGGLGSPTVGPGAPVLGVVGIDAWFRK